MFLKGYRAAMEWNRDLTRPLSEIREREASKADKKDRGRGTVCLPEMHRGQIGLCVATQTVSYTHLTLPPILLV